MRTPSAELFANFTPDPKFLVKPLLSETDDDGLYDNDNMDFAGQYRMRFSPYIFEPTYADGFIYDYPGPYRYDETWVNNEITPVADTGYPSGPGPYDPCSLGTCTIGYEKSVGYKHVENHQELQIGKGYRVLFDGAQSYELIGQSILRYSLASCNVIPFQHQNIALQSAD